MYTRGVAKLGHTGARALATGVCVRATSAGAPENYRYRMYHYQSRESGANYINVHKVVEIELRSIAIRI